MNLPRLMPPGAMARLMKVEGKGDAESLVAGLIPGVDPLVEQKAEEMLRFELIHPSVGEKSPLFLFASVDITGELPFGSSIVRFALPATEEMDQAEAIFRTFQDMTALVCAGILGASPFCALIGFDKENAWHPLNKKRVSLFFSSNPDRFFNKIETLLSLELRSRAAELRDPSEIDPRPRLNLLARLKEQLNNERRNLLGAQSPFLNEIRVFEYANTLVDLR